MASSNWAIARSVLAPPQQTVAKVVVRQGVIGFEADGFLELTDRLIHLAYLAQNNAKAVVRHGVIRFEADGFLELGNRLVNLAFLVERVAEVEVGNVIVFCHFQRMDKEGFTVLPMPELLPRQRQAEEDCR